MAVPALVPQAAWPPRLQSTEDQSVMVKVWEERLPEITLLLAVWLFSGNTTQRKELQERLQISIEQNFYPISGPIEDVVNFRAHLHTEVITMTSVVLIE